jgi:hypothetical protein
MYWVAGLPESLQSLLVATLIHLAWGNKLLINSALTVRKIVGDHLNAYELYVEFP